MDARDLDGILSGHPGYLGVLPINHVRKPRKLSENVYFCICNSDPCDKSGQHWLALFFFKKARRWHGASTLTHTGHPQKILVQLFTNLCFKGRYNIPPLQEINTSVCGYYCLYFLHHRLRGESAQDIIHRLFNFGSERDIFVYNFCLKLQQ